MLDVDDVLELECWLVPLEEHPAKNVGLWQWDLAADMR